ncbi:B3 domain-containing protein REM16 [Euphorbia lathyris]|uniref:B3 domain-containing protein REM16 n=1 Tax=Euphorbia lathyris TaxID=212925 RepID=UPI00331380ED
MQDEACEDRRSWEEEVYWTRFQSVQFSLFLHTGFERQLAIPEHFTRNLKRKLPDTVILKSPSGSEWEVGLTTKENASFFDHGWGEFVKDHSLKENDILIFKYNGESCLDVVLFNGQSMCEKVASYFFRKRCGHETQSHLKSSSGESSAGAVFTSPSDGIGGSQPKESIKKTVYNEPTRQHLNSRSVNQKVRSETEFTTPINTTNSAPNKEFSTSSEEEIDTKPDIGHANNRQSGRKPITEEDKRRVLELGRAILSPEGFLRVMQPTHVYKKFIMTIPLVWITKHLTFRKNHDIILRTSENTWRARIVCSKTSRHRGVLGGGWRRFVRENNLHEFDVCIFEPRGQLNNSMVLDVYICRVG